MKKIFSIIFGGLVLLFITYIGYNVIDPNSTQNKFWEERAKEAEYCHTTFDNSKTADISAKCLKYFK